MFLFNYPTQPCSVVTFYTGQVRYWLIMSSICLIVLPCLFTPFNYYYMY